MICRSSRSTTEAPVPTGRAPRRVAPLVPSVTRVPPVVRVTAGLIGLLAAGAVLAPVAQAQGGPVDPDVVAIQDVIDPAMPGVFLTVETTALGSQFVLENPTATEVTVLSTAGDPLFRVGPGGVLANFRSPDWYTSKEPDGAVAVPERAAPGGTPVWARVSQDPAWGWFDARLRTAALTVEQKAAATPLEPFGSWEVPVQFGDALGAVRGHFEYRPPLGSFTPELSDTSPAAQVTLSALPGNPTPAVAVQNTGPAEVLVLGDAGEPWLRITSEGTQANTLSPTWLATRPATTEPGDPAAPPLWELVGGGTLHTFTLDRAGPGADVAALYRLTEASVVREWTLSMLIDGRPVDVTGTTTLIPVGAGAGWGFWGIAGAVVAGLVLLGAGVWWLRRRGSAPPPRRPAGKREARPTVDADR